MDVKINSDKQKPGFYTIAPQGSIEEDSHGEFRKKVIPLLEKSPKGIIVDLASVNYISSAGFGVFFTIQKELSKTGGSLVFCHAKPQIKKLFDIMKAMPPESMFETLEEADNYFYSIMDREIKKQREGPEK